MKIIFFLLSKEMNFYFYSLNISMYIYVLLYFTLDNVFKCDFTNLNSFAKGIVKNLTIMIKEL